jgi:hypothetical protein
VLEVFFRSPRSIERANGPTKCGRYLLRFFLACGLAMGQTRVSAHVGREGEMGDLLEQPDHYEIAVDIRN